MDAHLSWLPPTADALPRLPQAAERWASFGPYYAMFPVPFARRVITELTAPGDSVLDPFSGRGTAIFCAGEAGRGALGIELNPVGWLFAEAKLHPAPVAKVHSRLNEIAGSAEEFAPEAARLPEFYRYCFSPAVLNFLLSARARLQWRTHKCDSTLMAFILTYLHGKIERGRPAALSNQMRQTKAMAPDYSVRWWIDHGLAEPPDISPVEFLSQRIDWRYRWGSMDLKHCLVRLGDCRNVLPRQRRCMNGTVRLLLTSPPYCGVTSYYYDQWLRLWMLGEPNHPSRVGGAWKSKFEDKTAYWELLSKAFRQAKRLLAPDATVYVRTDARPLTLDITKQVLADTFPNKLAEYVPAPYVRATQTSLFGDKLPKPGEFDLILRPR